LIAIREIKNEGEKRRKRRKRMMAMMTQDANIMD
jgi:hypothetical protein